MIVRPEIKKPEDLRGKKNRGDRDEEAAIGYDYYLASFSESILDLPDRRGLVFVIQETAKTNPNAVGQTPETLRLLEHNDPSKELQLVATMRARQDVPGALIEKILCENPRRFYGL